MRSAQALSEKSAGDLADTDAGDLAGTDSGDLADTDPGPRAGGDGAPAAGRGDTAPVGAPSRRETGPGDKLASEATQALELVYGDPRRALVLAEEMLTRPGLSYKTVAVAERAAALAELELGRATAARRRLERAKAEALAGELRSETAQLQIGLAVALLQAEEADAALSELESAELLADEPSAMAAVLAQRALVTMRLGHYDEALAESGPALDLCRATGQLDPAARLLSNRGVVHAYLGDFDRAEVELREALGILRLLDYELNAVQVVHNLGFVAARRGDVPAALRLYDEALASYERLGIPAHTLSVDRCELLMSANLLPEARLAAEESVAGLLEAGMAADLAEARLMLAEVALEEGDHVTARCEAGKAGATFERQHRSRWAVLARLVALRAGWAAGAPAEQITAEATWIAVLLESAGWPVHGLEARIAAGNAALRLGRPLQARQVLSGALDMTSADGAEDRSRAWYGVALSRLADEDRGGALRALSKGLDIADRHRATFGATELRVRAATSSAELADLGLRLSLGGRRPRSVLVWSERWRARSLWRPDVVPPRDGELARRLSDLRHTVAALEQNRLAGEATEDLASRRHRLESEIRNYALRNDGAGRRSLRPVAVRSLQRELGDHVLVEFVQLDGALHAVVVSQQGCRLRPLGPLLEIDRQRAALHFALSRLATRRSRRATLDTAADVLIRAARRLDCLLIAPLRRELAIADERAGSRPAGIVLVPTGELHTMPWALLPSLNGRAVSVAPSAALWHRHARAARPAPGEGADGGNGATVLVAGPGVAFASEELSLIEGCYRDPVVLQGADATAESVTHALVGAGVVHIAAHGRFRGDNALFSALDLADGPLTVYELERLERPPRVLVLSACDGGRSQVHPGDELMGTTAAMLSGGTRAIVASVAPVADAGAPALMSALHAHLSRSGSTPAAALAASQAGAGVYELDPAELAGGSPSALTALAGAAFVCFGAG